ncbi:MAG TPA: PSD1 and planctomycete cytochrome C domain-containing protein [Planctomycetaceae bacterium]|nr:PSD1 and planctomycete cytochrome C domain-containing protein [Planctomycetaceae bacterium]
MRRRFFRWTYCAIVMLVCAAPVAQPAAWAQDESAADHIEKRIRPLLIKRCEGCHSAAKGKTSGGLALDTRDGWLKGGDSGPAIAPSKPAESLLIRAVKYEEDGPQMPPSDKGGKLPAAEIAALVEWVERGAVDPRTSEARLGGMTVAEARHWWAFQPLQPVQPPEVNEQAWPVNAIDQFVLATLEQKGLQHIGPADKRTLIRRVTFDLTGLPPSPEEISAFLKDDSPRAWADLIDRLLASPAYGERWGRHWLDVARYADTAGDGADYPVREAVKYRDWVIQALNADRPYDRFVQEQIAGDILARMAPESEYANHVTATGFLAIGKRYGYAPNPDFQHLDFADVIDSVGRSLLGLSIGCARCHDHKYDPVTTNDYYALYGIFQSTKWAFPGGEEHKRPANLPPLVPAEEAERCRQAQAAEIARIDGEINRRKRERAKLDGKSFAGGVDLGIEGQALEKPPAAPWFTAGPNLVHNEAQSPYTHTHPAGTRGLRVGTGGEHDGVRYVFDNKLRATPGQPIHFTIDFRTVAPTDKTGAYRFYLGRGVLESTAVECSLTPTEFAIRNGNQWEILRKLEPGTWYTLQLTLDFEKKICSGVVGKPGDLTSFGDKGLNANWDGIADTFFCDAIGHIAGPAPVRDLDNLGLQFEAFGAPGSGPVVPAPAPADAKDQLARLDTELAQLTKQREAESARVAYPVAYGVSEGTPVNAKVQKRGEPDQPGDEVPRRFLEVLGGDALPAGHAGSGRLELAQWITRSSHPIAARVIVNRVWQWHFGRGLVPTSSDFGIRGEHPSHPELLEWLTAEFIRSGWSLKALHRLILQSRTWQLASNDDAANLQADPGNRWLWRYSRHALDAESLRDAMLAVSGRLNRSIPGEHPFPPVASWGFTIHAPFHQVYDSDHRSVYLMVQRNRRHPFLALFDAADPNQSVAERLPTTTPTQTLFLMNSSFVHEQSQGLARRLLAQAGDDAARVRFAFELVEGRAATESEIRDAVAFVTAYRQKLVGQGQAEDQAATAAWAALGRVLLTSNAFLFVD